MKKQMLTWGLTLTLSVAAMHPVVLAKDTVADTPNKEFTKFLEEDFKDTLERDYPSLHSYVAHPETYGIDVDKMDVDLGDITTTDEDRKELKKTEKKLKTFDYSTLDKTQQEIYDAYTYENKLAEKMYDKKYTYLTNIWSLNNGLQNSYGSFFSDYELYSEKDIKPLITLLKDMKRLSRDAISFSKKQADKGLLYMNYKDVTEDLQENIDSQKDSSITVNLMEQVDHLNLSEAKTNKYKTAIQNALDKNYFPAYTYMKKELKKLKPAIKAPVSMAEKGKEGKELYALTVQLNSGTTKDIKGIRNDFLEFNEDAVRILQDSEAAGEITTAFTSSEEILKFLESKYTTNFPEIRVPAYNIESIPKEQTSKNVVAYFKHPAIDETPENKIRFNDTDWGDDAASLSFYQTFAHEGIPGHMYARAYANEHNTYDIQYLFNGLCYAEGYATYVEEQALYYLDSTKKEDVKYTIAYSHFNNSMLAILDIDINYNGLTKTQFINKYDDLLNASSLKEIYKTLTNNPGIFISYYYGELKIYQLREKAEKQLGDTFNEKRFHEALLEMQDVNFEIVERNIDDYISETKHLT